MLLPLRHGNYGLYGVVVAEVLNYQNLLIIQKLGGFNNHHFLLSQKPFSFYSDFSPP
jgi:hypothetical protein